MTIPNPDPVRRANRYLNLVRNGAKRQYGLAYLLWLQTGAVGVAPEPSCSYMAAQAVRMELHEILGKDPMTAARGDFPSTFSLYECEKGARWSYCNDYPTLRDPEAGVCVFSCCGDGKHTYRLVRTDGTREEASAWFRRKP